MPQHGALRRWPLLSCCIPAILPHRAVDRENALQTARILHQGLPYLRHFASQYLVMKLGGQAITDPALLQNFARDAVLLQQVGIYPLVVHGGGPHITRLLGERGIESSFENGLRVTDQNTMVTVAEALAGVNREVGANIDAAGGRAAAFPGALSGLLHARPISPRLGRVGEVATVDTRTIIDATAAGSIPVIAPVGSDDRGLLNINADLAASRIAEQLHAAKLIFLTDVPGIQNAAGQLIKKLDAQTMHRLIDAGTIQGGMQPKALCALAAADAGIHQVHIIDARLPHAVLLEIFTDQGVGTLITSSR